MSRCWTVAGGLIFAVLVVVYSAWLFSVRRVPPDQQALTKSEIEAGVPIQRKRIDDFIRQTGAYRDFDELAAGLNERDVSDIVVSAALPGGGLIAEPSFFGMVLADRRVARLYEMLAKMSEIEADQQVQNLFRSKRAIHAKDWSRAMAEWRHNDDGQISSVPLRQNYRALCCALFLCSRFCPAARLLEFAADWDETLSKLQAEIETDPALHVLRTEMREAGRPHPLFLVNVYLSALDRKDGVDLKRLRERLGSYARLLTLATLPLVSWDAQTNPFDFTHTHKGVPVDTSRVLTQVTFAKNWQNVALASVERRREAVAYVHRLVQEVAEGE